MVLLKRLKADWWGIQRKVGEGGENFCLYEHFSDLDLETFKGLNVLILYKRLHPTLSILRCLVPSTAHHTHLKLPFPIWLCAATLPFLQDREHSHNCLQTFVPSTLSFTHALNPISLTLPPKTSELFTLVAYLLGLTSVNLLLALSEAQMNCRRPHSMPRNTF